MATAAGATPPPMAAIRCFSFLLFFLSAAATATATAAASSTTSTAALSPDMAALLRFKASISDPSDSLRSWTPASSPETTATPCYWTGISCTDPDPDTTGSSGGRVVSLQLQGLSLSGNLPSAALQSLPFLQSLSLANNNLSGSFADAARLLPSSLRKLDLSHNSLSGALPPLALPSLASLDLSHNLLTASFPADLFTSDSCRGLRFLSLAANSFQGSVPSSLAFCSDLHVLNLSSNRLSGALPSGTFEALLELKILDLSENHLSGDLPPLPPSLVEARLQRNEFTGSMASLRTAGCAGLQRLDVSSNQLTGPVPEEMKGLGSMTELDVSHNAITGGIPPWLGTSLNSLRLLNLAFNQLSDRIPPTIGLLKGLLLLDLSRNMLSGEIPATMSGCDSLKILDLSSNSLQGPLPEILPPSLISVSLACNSLSGAIPGVLYRRCTSLERLDLSENQLSGAPPSLAQCPALQYVNVSSNEFTGAVPEFSTSGNISVVDMSHNQLSGRVPASVREAAFLTVLRLDHNRLEGTIPREISKCSSLTCLNLSQNNLTGSIPPEMGALQNLQQLDLSHNSISGEMPSELGRLLKLEDLNLSYNQLEGPVPGYGALLKFNRTSFVGNSRLCGANVNVTCPTAVPKPLVLDPATIGALPDIQSILPRTMARTPHKRATLSVSAIVAIAAATAISAGVVVILFLNAHAAGRRQAASLPPPPQSSIGINSSAFAPSLKSGGGPTAAPSAGKLVMFSKTTDPRSEQWITSAHALLNKDAEMGRGGESGAIYKAVLADGRTVVIKKLTLSMPLAEFDKEMQLLGRVKHKNLLSLQGYYWTPPLQLLIYDFIPNGNLYRKLHEQNHIPNAAVMDWPARFRIAVGVARGLAHLHYGCDPPIIHYHVKSSNILLDDRGNPKIADCGLAALLPVPDRYMASIAKSQSAALGYMAPELAVLNSRVDSKCDVYGYGILLLELVTGRRPLEYVGDDAVLLSDYVRGGVEKGKAMACVDPRMREYTEEEVLPVIKLGLICSMHVASGRPSMAEVVQILERVKAAAAGAGGSSSSAGGGGSREVL